MVGSLKNDRMIRKCILERRTPLNGQDHIPKCQPSSGPKDDLNYHEGDICSIMQAEGSMPSMPVFWASTRKGRRASIFIQDLRQPESQGTTSEPD